MICERCSRDIFKYNTCNYCKKKICVNCMKSSRKVTKTTRLVICRDCWSKMPKRKTFKSATVETA
ncbi:MAG: hypothetical protein KGH61_00270 [Candidatus Micrarchaeota archaeon]|nr:hypothetical protein [Candidatus Micrarchaeota archaeon]MDE1847371.1 hypothetical protein [Candidatus Micrarchaeota archaeon]MDE1863986.1 hypothetical protein [Candidatus Micrarchaeota archaeon]